MIKKQKIKTTKEWSLLENRKIQEAAIIYAKRQDRKSHPLGEFDKQKRWYPDKEENLDTGMFRSPSCTWPFSYLIACRSCNHVTFGFCEITKEEIATEIEYEEVEDKEILLAVKRYAKAFNQNEFEKFMITDYFFNVSVPARS